MSAELAQWTKAILRGDIRSVSRALTRVESSSGAESVDLLRALYPHSGGSRTLGITGSPGVGKSTLIDQLIRNFRQKDKVGVIAVDPTSPFSGGAILGDRIRMQALATDPRVFIRSMATRGKLGGLAPSVGDALLVLSAAGYSTILVETVGVGQDEIDIVRTAQVTTVVLSPGMGDDIQTIKAGIMEIGDVFVINKADRDGASRTRQEVETLLSLARPVNGWRPPVIETVATRGQGIGDLVETIARCYEFYKETGIARERSLRAHREWLTQKLTDGFVSHLMGVVSDSELDQLARQIMDRKADPFEVVAELLKRFLTKGASP